MFCQNCGHQLPEFARFCTHCGAPQAGTAQGGPWAGQNEAPPQQPYTQQQYTQQQYTQQPYTQQQYTKQQYAQQPYTQEQAQQQQTWAANEKAFKQYIGPSPKVFLVSCLLTVVFWFVLSDMVGLTILVAFFSGVIWLFKKVGSRMQISALKSAGTYEEMLREFAASLPELDGKVRYSQNYIWGRRCGNAVAFRDICWLYRYSGSTYFIPVISRAMAGDPNGLVKRLCKLSLGGKKGNEELAVLAVLIRPKNPEVLVGYSVETIAEYKKRTKKKKAR